MSQKQTAEDESSLLLKSCVLYSVTMEKFKYISVMFHTFLYKLLRTFYLPLSRSDFVKYFMLVKVRGLCGE